MTQLTIYGLEEVYLSDAIGKAILGIDREVDYLEDKGMHESSEMFLIWNRRTDLVKLAGKICSHNYDPVPEEKPEPVVKKEPEIEVIDPEELEIL